MACKELHCFEEHGFDYQVRDAALRETFLALADAYHRTHDDQFPSHTCADQVCRDTHAMLSYR